MPFGLPCASTLMTSVYTAQARAQSILSRAVCKPCSETWGSWSRERSRERSRDLWGSRPSADPQDGFHMFPSLQASWVPWARQSSGRTSQGGSCRSLLVTMCIGVAMAKLVVGYPRNLPSAIAGGPLVCAGVAFVGAGAVDHAGIRASLKARPWKAGRSAGASPRCCGRLSQFPERSLLLGSGSSACFLSARSAAPAGGQGPRSHPCGGLGGPWAGRCGRTLPTRPTP